MKTIVILLDSLNRHLLNAYGNDWIRTPNIDRFAQQNLVFNNHYCGSAPCMPARREMMTGRINFLESSWGPVEPYDTTLPEELRRQKGTYSHLITDHYHYFHGGGENYHTLFDSWEFMRGQEGDVWRPRVGTPEIPPTRGKSMPRRAYWANRERMDSEDDLAYSTPQCFMQAVEFLEHNHAADNWHLHLEVFDPHEPFDCPQRWLDYYDDTREKDWLYNWPSYQQVGLDGEDSDDVEHIRKRYAATLSMADHYLGKLFDAVEEYGLWEDTTIILTTDHGHMLGEHGYWAKNYMMDYHEIFHIPLMISTPEIRGERERIDALTTTIDLVPTLFELHGAEIPESVQGKSLCHLLEQDEEHHDMILYGYFSKDINMTDGRYTYHRQPLPDSKAYHHTLCPRNFRGYYPKNMLQNAEYGEFLPYADMKVLRLEIPSHRHADAPDFNPLYDLTTDPGQTSPIIDPELEKVLAEKLRALMKRYEAPEWQYARVGLSAPENG